MKAAATEAAPRRPIGSAALPERTIWGSDWPHIPKGEMDTGSLLELLGDWIADAKSRDRILAANPAHLYGFP